MRKESYPSDENGAPLDTPEWRNADSIRDTASPKDPPIVAAVRVWDTTPEQLEAALAAAGADLAGEVNRPDRFGFTPLMLAVKSKQPGLVDKLLEVEGVQLDAQSKRGFSALMIAAWKADDTTIDKLVAKGADLSLRDGGGRNAWGVAHDWHNEGTLDCLGRHGLTFTSHGGTSVAFPPAPKWRPDEAWD
mmetsp:Transcript_46778/g.151916  ORF Transcript_46778/g.151916 Transcript_46778/m.151916 type:complete len:190 (-) Transcript_46778:380-949(-)